LVDLAQRVGLLVEVALVVVAEFAHAAVGQRGVVQQATLPVELPALLAGVGVAAQVELAVPLPDLGVAQGVGDAGQAALGVVAVVHPVAALRVPSSEFRVPSSEFRQEYMDLTRSL
jgi:hypothetical protein